MTSFYSRDELLQLGFSRVGEDVLVSRKASIYGAECISLAVSDDYSGEYMTNPMIPEKYKNTVEQKVVIEKHVIIASGSTILPGTILGEGCAIGAMSLVKKNVEPWIMVAGIPAKYIKARSRRILDLETRFMQEACSD